MKIGIDVSQAAYSNTGVANYLSNLILKIIEIDKKNEYVLFFSSLRGSLPSSLLELESNSNIKIKVFKYPPAMLNLLWNTIHKFPIENFIGEVDMFITSDWTEPPARRANKATIIYDLIVYKHPEETDQKIVSVQKRKLEWVKKESNIVFCISESTKKDIIEILGIDESKIKVIYPGI